MPHPALGASGPTISHPTFRALLHDEEDVKVDGGADDSSWKAALDCSDLDVDVETDVGMSVDVHQRNDVSIKSEEQKSNECEEKSYENEEKACKPKQEAVISAPSSFSSPSIASRPLVPRPLGSLSKFRLKEMEKDDEKQEGEEKDEGEENVQIKQEVAAVFQSVPHRVTPAQERSSSTTDEHRKQVGTVQSVGVGSPRSSQSIGSSTPSSYATPFGSPSSIDSGAVSSPHSTSSSWSACSSVPVGRSWVHLSRYPDLHAAFIKRIQHVDATREKVLQQMEQVLNKENIDTDDNMGGHERSQHHDDEMVKKDKNVHLMIRERIEQRFQQLHVDLSHLFLTRAKIQSAQDDQAQRDGVEEGINQSEQDQHSASRKYKGMRKGKKSNKSQCVTRGVDVAPLSLSVHAQYGSNSASHSSLLSPRSKLDALADDEVARVAEGSLMATAKSKDESNGANKTANQIDASTAPNNHACQTPQPMHDEVGDIRIRSCPMLPRKQTRKERLAQAAEERAQAEEGAAAAAMSEGHTHRRTPETATVLSSLRLHPSGPEGALNDATDGSSAANATSPVHSSSCRRQLVFDERKETSWGSTLSVAAASIQPSTQSAVSNTSILCTHTATRAGVTTRSSKASNSGSGSGSVAESTKGVHDRSRSATPNRQQSPYLRQLAMNKPMEEWFSKNLDDPYPSAEVKWQLSVVTGLSYEQVQHWFINARMRKRKRMLEERDKLRKRKAAIGATTNANANDDVDTNADDEDSPESNKPSPSKRARVSMQPSSAASPSVSSVPIPSPAANPGHAPTIHTNAAHANVEPPAPSTTMTKGKKKLNRARKM